MAKLTREWVQRLAGAREKSVIAPEDRADLCALALEAFDGRETIERLRTQRRDIQDLALADRDAVRVLRVQLARAEAVVDAVREWEAKTRDCWRGATLPMVEALRAHDAAKGSGHTGHDGTPAECLSATPASAGSEGTSRGDRCRMKFTHWAWMPEGYQKPIASGTCEYPVNHDGPCGPNLATATYSGPEPAIRAVTEAATTARGDSVTAESYPGAQDDRFAGLENELRDLRRIFCLLLEAVGGTFSVRWVDLERVRHATMHRDEPPAGESIVFRVTGVAPRVAEDRTGAYHQRPSNMAQTASPAVQSPSSSSPGKETATTAVGDGGQGADLPHGQKAIHFGTRPGGEPITWPTAHYDDVVALAGRVARIEREEGIYLTRIEDNAFDRAKGLDRIERALRVCIEDDHGSRWARLALAILNDTEA